jgi:hypothetical protein
LSPLPVSRVKKAGILLTSTGSTGPTYIRLHRARYMNILDWTHKKGFGEDESAIF